MNTALKAGAAYFAAVFVCAFLLGAIRVSLVEPRVGAFAATALETPLVLGIAWIACGIALRRFGVGPDRTLRLIMGAAAFALLIATEMLLGLFVFSRPLAVQAMAWTTPAGMLGLAAQIAFAALPLVRLARSRAPAGLR